MVGARICYSRETIQYTVFSVDSQASPGKYAGALSGRKAVLILISSDAVDHLMEFSRFYKL